MAGQNTTSPVTLHGLLIKGLLLFLVFNLAFAALDPLPLVGRISAYNWLLPGRSRLPYGDRPELAYNISLFSLEAMFASHEIAGPEKALQEYRVVLIGDSATWGFLLKPEQTLSAQMNAARLETTDGKQVRVFNLGYPTMSLTKDLLILSQAMKYQPDLIVWLLTLESFPDSKQLDSPIIQNNPDLVRPLIESYNLDIQPDDPLFVKPSYMQRSIIGQRRALADILRLQLYGILWAATGIDQYYPDQYDPPQANLDADEGFHDLALPTLDPADLALENLEAGVMLADGIPVLFVNEPVYISQGKNSDIRYNFFYPRWAYDQYRTLMMDLTQNNGWYYLDEWNLIPPAEFTNSAIHFSPAGEALLSEEVGTAILNIANP
jgi:hypothetical protein